MEKLPHTAFYITHDGDKAWLMEQVMTGNLFDFNLAFKDLRGEIFSTETLQYFIDEELRHDHFEIVAGKNNTLACSSSGEQRKALLSYIIGKKPGFIIIDNVFESLDKDTRQLILQTLKEIASSTILIQVFNRKRELLPFIQTVYSIAGCSVVEKQAAEIFLSGLKLKGSEFFTGTIPPPLTHYELESSTLVKMNNISVQFNGQPVLENICWEIKKGDFWQLAGPNGSGKSTLLALITGNSPKGYGQDLEIFGHRKGSGETVWELKEKIGYFTPSMTLHFERLDSIEQMIISGFFDSVGLYIKPSDRQVQLAREWLVLIGMNKNKNQAFRMLPDGHQRMILIARAMVKHPPLLILDEPTSGLDDEMAVLFTGLINKIAAETGTAILYVSHKEEEDLFPGRVFELFPGENGSVGKIIR